MHRLSRPSPWWRRIWPSADQPFRAAILAGLGMGLLFWSISSCEVSSTQNRPVEDAEVAAVDEHRSLLGCGRGGGPELDVTYRSENPPAGLPTEFTDIGSCNGDFQVGETVDVVRVVHDGELKVYVEPVRSYSQAWKDGLAGAVIGFVAIAGLLLARLLTIRAWAARRRSRTGGTSTDRSGHP